MVDVEVAAVLGEHLRRAYFVDERFDGLDHIEKRNLVESVVRIAKLMNRGGAEKGADIGRVLGQGVDAFRVCLLAVRLSGGEPLAENRDVDRATLER